MKRDDIYKTLPKALPSLVIFLLPMLFAALLLYNLGSIIAWVIPSDESAKFDFGLIFDQLSDASLSLHFVLPLVCAALFFVLLVFVFKGIKSKLLVRSVSVLAFVVLSLLSFASALMLTSVNGIRFYDLLSKLIPLIDKL